MLTCKLCNQQYQHLGSHVWHKHHLKARMYKKMFGLDYNHPLITKEIKIKKQKHFNANKEKYLKNLQGEEYRFKKGVSNRNYFSQESRQRALNNLKKIEDDRIKLTCPYCEVKYNNLQIHLINKHNVKITKNIS